MIFHLKKLRYVLVTGACGFVGTELCKKLREEDFIVLPTTSRLPTFSEALPESEMMRAEWRAILYGVDAVIHLAARVHVMNDAVADPLAEFRKVNVDGTLNLAREAAQAGVKRFIYMSSIKVNGESTEFCRPFTETVNPNPQDAYGISKLEAEQGLLQISKQTGMDVVIIRPPLVYGSGVKANFASMIRTIKRGISLPLGAIHNKRSFVYVGNLVSLIECCIKHPAAANQVFLVSDGDDLSTTELLQRCATALGVKARLLPVPQRLIEICATLLGKRAIAQRLCGNLQVDITKARTMLGWNPPFTVIDGLKATVTYLDKTSEQ